MRQIYLDNGATSFPKPEGVAEAMLEYMNAVGANINRSVYGKAQEAALVVLSLRERLCSLFHFDDPTRVILTSGATEGLNLVIRGRLKAGDHCLVSSMEHNAVMRPLQHLTASGVVFDRIPCNSEGYLDPAVIPQYIRENTKMLIMAHGSNVCGAVQNAAAVGKVCREHSIEFVLDAAQTAGHLPIDFEAMQLSAAVFPGHKGLMGPAGTGAVLMTADFAAKTEPLIYGGTGSASHEEVQPIFLPDRFESGTRNLPGLYGLEKAVFFVENTGVEKICAHEAALTKLFLQHIEELEGIAVVGPKGTENRTGVVSLDFINADNGEAAYRLEQEFGILTRCGLHCAPSAHKTLGTYPRGTVRFSFGWFNSEEDIYAAAEAVKKISEG